MARAPHVGRTLETGSVLGLLTALLAATGLLLSPTLMGALGLAAALPGVGNPLYVAHLVAAALLVAFLAWHLWPYAYAFARKAGQTVAQRASSFILFGLALVEIVTGYELWSHQYVLIPKEVNVGIHLATTFLLLAPLVVHARRGVLVWRARRQARKDALAAADAAGVGAQAREQQRGVSRRTFLRVAGYVGLGGALALVLGAKAREDVGGWRLNSIGAIPKLTKENYRLKVTGLVNRPVELTYNDLLALPVVEQRFTHHCVEGWTYTDTFTGVRLSDVLAKAGGAKEGAAMLVFRSPEVSRQMFTYGEQYSSSFPLKPGVAESALVVFAVGGKDLPPQHGFPVRLMTPKKWGFKACKWLTQIDVTADPSYRGYWEREGYHHDGDWPGPIWEA